MVAFPQWDGKPVVQPAQDDLIYPDWMAGTWTMTSTLVEMVASNSKFKF
ncbi:MAG: hypothetical protein HC866_13595 [Leptolyngbyaceae cyanobacterium RU_5_1]|nr:hypothetical protein [Leptolyngbyaceae cyanobacterium RU_5_1]